MGRLPERLQLMVLGGALAVLVASCGEGKEQRAPPPRPSNTPANVLKTRETKDAAGAAHEADGQPAGSATSEGDEEPSTESVAKTTKDPVWVDHARGIMWTVNVGPKMSWAEAQAYMKEFRYAGYQDWRLPSRADLVSLIVWEMVEDDDDSLVTPLRDPFRKPRTGYMFSGTVVSPRRTGQPWIMNLRNAHIFNGHKYRGYVRAVRDVGRDDSK